MVQEDVMKYLCLVIYDEKKLEAMSKSELEALDIEGLAFDDSPRKSGHLVAAADPLQPIIPISNDPCSGWRSASKPLTCARKNSSLIGSGQAPSLFQSASAPPPGDLQAGA